MLPDFKRNVEQYQIRLCCVQSKGNRELIAIFGGTNMTQWFKGPRVTSYCKIARMIDKKRLLFILAFCLRITTSDKIASFQWMQQIQMKRKE